MMITTGIVVDRLTATGRVYPRNVVEKMIADFDPNSPSAVGGILDRRAIESKGRATHRVKRLFLMRDELMAEIDVLDETLAEDVRSGGYVAKPVVISGLGRPSDVRQLRRIDIEKRR